MTSSLTTINPVMAVDDKTEIAPFPNTSAATWAHDDPSHPGFLVNGLDDTPGRKAYLILLEAKPGHEDAVAAFLRDINAGVEQEPGTGPWFGLRYSKTTFFIFEAFANAADRHTHDGGPGGQNFLRSDELKEMLAWPAQLLRLDVMHGKFGVLFGEKIVKETMS
jgi:quinol monooxygenase YgiN